MTGRTIENRSSRTSALKWCGDPPVAWETLIFCTENVPFNGEIATAALQPRDDRQTGYEGTGGVDCASWKDRWGGLRFLEGPVGWTGEESGGRDGCIWVYIMQKMRKPENHGLTGKNFVKS